MARQMVKPLTLLALLLLSCGSVGAVEISSTTVLNDPGFSDLFIAPDNMGWRVIKGTQSYTLSEFVSSGKFCEWRGKHEWGSQKLEGRDFTSPMQDGCGGWVNSPDQRPEKCSICGKCRGKIKVKEEVERLEP